MSKSRDIADSAATINYIDGLTSDAQGQLDEKATLDGSPTFTGTVTATAFSGDGSGLTGVDSLPSQSGQSGKFLTTDGSAASWDAVDVSSDITGTLPVANGGTGATTLTANSVLLGNGTSAPLTVSPSTSGNVLTSNGTTWQSVAPAGGGAWTKLNTYNLSSGTSSFSANSILDTTTYSRFVIIIDDVILTSPYSRDLYIKLTGDNGSSYTDSTKWTSIFERAGNATANSAAVTQITVADSPAVTSKGLFNIEITKPINSRVKGETNGGYEGVNYGHCTIRGSSYWNLSTLTGFQITVDSPATFDSGTITVYGVE